MAAVPPPGIAAATPRTGPVRSAARSASAAAPAAPAAWSRPAVETLNPSTAPRLGAHPPATGPFRETRSRHLAVRSIPEEEKVCELLDALGVIAPDTATA